MSGGVDSSVCAMLLKDHGHDVLGVYLVMNKNLDMTESVKKVAKKIGIKFMTKDVSVDFGNQVVEYFIDEYKKNRTPNPCVVCNPKLKFATLLGLADELGIEKVATGHYACIAHDEKDTIIKTVEDKKKDQTYFLYRLSHRQLWRIIFPLCEMSKEDVKKISQENNLPIFEKESQDVCFFQENESLKKFLKKHYKSQKGEIVDERGNVVGSHDGYAFFTLGQRHGLGLSGGPFYVVGKNKKRNQIVVTNDQNHKLLWSSEIKISKPSWVSNSPKPGKKYKVKTRYRVVASEGFIEKLEKNCWIAKLEKPQWAVAPGQSLVVYDGEELIGGGFIVD